MTNAPQHPRSILITGASSGIGAALALAYAAPGVHLALSGRDAGRLEATARACRARGARVAASVVDVRHRDAMAAWVEETDAAAALDLVIANAGISAGTGRSRGDKDGQGSLLKGEDAAQAEDIFAVNLMGVLNTVGPVIPAMRVRGRGQIALISSMAGFHGLPGAPAYAASKAAVRSYGEGLRGWLAGDGVRVSVVIPGFVESRITAKNKFPMPFLMTAERAAGIIRRGLAQNRGRIAFPWPLYAGVRLAALLPVWLLEAFTRRLPEKT